MTDKRRGQQGADMNEWLRNLANRGPTRMPASFFGTQSAEDVEDEGDDPDQLPAA